MHPLSRALFLTVPAALTALGFAGHLLTPMAHRSWLGWFALSAVACGLLIRSIRPMALRRRAWSDPRSGPLEEVPRLAHRLYLAATAVGFAYFLAVFLLPVGQAAALMESVHMGQWLCLCFMPFAAASVGVRGEGWLDAVLCLAAALLPVPMLLLTGDHYSARMWMVAAAPVFAVVPGSRRIKILAAVAAALLAAAAWAASHFGIRLLLPLFSWIFEGRSPLSGSFMLSLQHAVYRLAGAWGAGAEFIHQVGLISSGDMALNGVPYLALWLGTRVAGLAVGAVALMLAASFAEIMLLRSPPRRAVATGMWFLCAANAYTGILALFFPEFLSVSYGAWGLPFIGSFESSLELLILLLVIFTGEVVPARPLKARAPASPPPPSRLGSLPPWTTEPAGASRSVPEPGPEHGSGPVPGACPAPGDGHVSRCLSEDSRRPDSPTTAFPVLEDAADQPSGSRTGAGLSGAAGSDAHIPDGARSAGDPCGPGIIGGIGSDAERSAGCGPGETPSEDSPIGESPSGDSPSGDGRSQDTFPAVPGTMPGADALPDPASPGGPPQGRSG
ncbi:MAG: hypothetical protein LBQ79_12390 [Deltaproteobacteria bacterium]|jgi:hypothetical protein|nr:hypothetical protein [Deltaproteobacteria bacterium]